MSAAPRIRKARLGDIEGIADLIGRFARQGVLLPRTKEEICRDLREFFVAEVGQVVGCCGLRTGWTDMAEVRSLAVMEEQQRQGVATGLVKAAVQEARELGYARVFALTYAPGFFERLGFARVDKGRLPHKIWTDCVKCRKFPNCDETAVLLEFEGKKVAADGGASEIGRRGDGEGLAT